MGGEPLCPSPKVWRLGLIAWLYDRIIIHLEARRQSVPCPQCGVKSSRVHSRYRRRASDLPWSSCRSNWWFTPANSSVTISSACVASSPRPFQACWCPMPARPSDWDRSSWNWSIPATRNRQPGSVGSWAIPPAQIRCSDARDRSKSLRPLPG